MDETTNIGTPAEDARRTRILQGAKEAFLAYGFQRTTMDDIARAAEISRPALYLMFRNKTDIYRALAAGFVEEMISHARATLSADGTLAERLETSIGSAIDMHSDIEASPHGAEILDMKNSLAADIIAEWRSRMVDLVEAAIEAQQAGSTAPAVSARLLAIMLLDAIDGMKMRRLPVGEQRKTASAFIRVVTEAAGE